MSDPDWDRTLERTQQDRERGISRTEEDEERALTRSERRNEATAVRTEQSQDRTESNSDRVLKLVKIMAVVMVVKLVIIGGLGYLVQKNNENNEETQAVLHEINLAVQELKVVADDIAEITPEEQASGEAIARAVSIVPIILQVVCEANPDVPSCQG